MCKNTCPRCKRVTTHGGYTSSCYDSVYYCDMLYPPQKCNKHPLDAKKTDCTYYTDDVDQMNKLRDMIENGQISMDTPFQFNYYNKGNYVYDGPNGIRIIGGDAGHENAFNLELEAVRPLSFWLK